MQPLDYAIPLPEPHATFYEIHKKEEPSITSHGCFSTRLGLLVWMVIKKVVTTEPISPQATIYVTEERPFFSCIRTPKKR